MLVAGEETRLHLWGSGLSRRVEVGLTAAQGVQGTPCRALVTPPLAPDTATHDYASFTVPAIYTESIPIQDELKLWVCTQEQHPFSAHNTRTRHAGGGWVHQGPNARLLLKASVHKLR